MRVQTHSLKAYAASRQVSIIKALHELWRIAHGREPRTEEEILAISQDLIYWRSTGATPVYVTSALQHERLVQTEHHARASPQGFTHFP